MDYEKKAREKLETLQGLMFEQKMDISINDSHFLEQIRKLENGDDKKYFNDVRNKINEAMSKGDHKVVKEIISDLKSKALNLSNAS